MSDKSALDRFRDAMDAGSWGHFPFGQPNLRRLPTLPTDTSGDVLAVLGVYPSALHLSWEAPGGKERTPALPVDVEPTVFWTGDNGADRAARIDEWKTATHDDGTHGEFGWATFNGMSGLGVAADYLEPLGFTYAQCWLTDCVPFYFVKSGKGEQGAAIRKKWQPCADEHGWPGGDLPSRPSTQIVGHMAADSARGLAAELASGKPAAIVTLGQEAADALATTVEVVARPPGVPLQFQDDEYGNPGTIRLDGREVTWIPLAHPGVTGRPNTAWHEAHSAWKSVARGLRSGY